MKIVTDISVGSPQPAREIQDVPLLIDFGSSIYRSGTRRGLSDILLFSRETPATYISDQGVIKTAPANALRIENSAALLEQSTTNLLKQSVDIGDAIWQKHSVSVTPSSIAAPDGTTAQKVIMANTAGIQRIAQPWIPESGVTYTQSVYLRSGGARFIYLNVDANMGARLAIDLETGSFVEGGVAGRNASVTDVGNGWWRASITGTGTEASGNNTWIQANASLAAGDQQVSGDGTAGFYAWGAQLEKGDAATSLIRTGTSPESRDADTIGLRAISGTFDLRVDYLDGSFEMLDAIQIPNGWWPQTDKSVKRIRAEVA